MNISWIGLQFFFRYVFLCRNFRYTGHWAGDADTVMSFRTVRTKVLVACVAGFAAFWNGVILFNCYFMFHPLEGFHEHGMRVLMLSDWPDNGKQRFLFGSHMVGLYRKTLGVSSALAVVGRMATSLVDSLLDYIVGGHCLGSGRL